MNVPTVLMRQPHRARCRLVEARDAIEYRGLAGAVRPDQRGDLLALCGKGEIVDRDNAAEAHRQTFDGKNVAFAHPWPSLTRSDEMAWACRRNTVGARWPI